MSQRLFPLRADCKRVIAVGVPWVNRTTGPSCACVTVHVPWVRGCGEDGSSSGGIVLAERRLWGRMSMQPEMTTRPHRSTAFSDEAPGELSLRIETIGAGAEATVVVWVSGEIDLANVPALRDVFAHRRARLPPRGRPGRGALHQRRRGHGVGRRGRGRPGRRRDVLPPSTPAPSAARSCASSASSSRSPVRPAEPLRPRSPRRPGP